MLVEHATSLPVGDEWEYEYVWPGERVLASKDGASVRLTSVLHRRDLTNRFPVVAALVAKLNHETVVLDGIVGPVEPALLPGETAKGAPPSGPTRIALLAADLLWLDDLDARQGALSLRRQQLRSLIAHSGILPPYLPTLPAEEMIADARRLGAEAVIAKRRDSKYRPYGRNGDWVRVAVAPTAAPARTERLPATPSRNDHLRAGTGALGLGQMA